MAEQRFPASRLFANFVKNLEGIFTTDRNTSTAPTSTTPPTDGNRQPAISPKMNVIRSWWTRLIGSSNIFGLRRRPGLFGLTLLSVPLLPLYWYWQPWLWSVDNNQIWSIVRIIAYTIISVSFVFNAIDDNIQNRRTDIVWAALAAEHIAVLALLALDLGDVVSWMDTRLYLTPTTAIAALAVAWQTSQRVIARTRSEEEQEA